MNIGIISQDKRFTFVRDTLLSSGHKCSICDIDTYCDYDALVLSPRMELDCEKLRKLFLKVEGKTIVISGRKDIISKYFDGVIYDYADNEAFLLRNAYITAQCALKLTLENIDTLVYGKRTLIVGYGRIGKYLASMLKALGAVIFVYARREESRLDAMLNGCTPVSLEDISELNLDLVYNTVPDLIIEKHHTELIPRKSLIIELASSPGGFVDKSRVLNAQGLPGKMMVKSAAEAIYSFIDLILQGKDTL